MYKSFWSVWLQSEQYAGRFYGDVSKLRVVLACIMSSTQLLTGDEAVATIKDAVSNWNL